MTTGRLWDVESWVVRMFGDPLRAGMARRLVWRLRSDDATTLALPLVTGLVDADGRPVVLPASATVELWHPAQDPDAQPRWRERLAALGVHQPIDQADRDVVLPDAVPSVVAGRHVVQGPFRGFLRRRGWSVPYLGRFDDDTEARRVLAPGGPVAVLDLELADPHDPEELVLGELRFRSAGGGFLDAAGLPPALASEAARDVLGGVHAAG
jgi:hypothetical protein